MKIDLASMIRRVGRQTTGLVYGRAINPTQAHEAQVQAVYMRVVRGWLSEWGERILPEYNRTLAGFPGIGDSVDSTQATVDEAAGAMTRLVLALGADLENWVVTVERWHRKQFASSFTPAGVKLDTLLGAGEAQATLKAVLAENVSLIRSLDDQVRNGISGSVFRGLQNRTPARDVAREIRKVAEVGKARADLIAADQLQKLSARLDQERQQQVGAEEFEWLHSRKRFPRPEHVERNGKVYRWDSNIGKTDPPGRAIRCGCRSRPIIDLDKILAGEQSPAPAPVATPAPKPKPAPVPVPAPPPAPAVGYRPVRRDNVNAETIPVQARLALQKRLRGEFSEAAGDARYTAREFGDRTDKDFGNATFSAAWDDEAASMVAALKPELDDLAEQIGVPKLRGFKSISGTKHVANQGDGVMALNPSYFNAYAQRVGGRGASGALDKIEAQRAALQVEIRPYVEQMQAIRAERNGLSMGDPRYRELSNREQEIYKPYAALRKKDEALWKKQQVLKRGDGEGNVKGVTTWKPGDDPKGKPFSIGAYFDNGVDQARATLYHEFGHHVHQYLKKEGPRRQYGKPPLERELITFYRQALHNRARAQASKYSMTNEHEWFAENFSLFALGRRDLVDETALALIERIFAREY